MIISVFCLSCILNMDCYKILKVAELEEYIKFESRTLANFDLQLPNTNAYVFFLKSGNVLLAPNSLSGTADGLLFENKECYEEFRNNDTFPIENASKTTEEKFQNELTTIEPSLKNYIATASSKEKLIENDYHDTLNFLIGNLKENRKKLSEKDFFFSVLLLGEFIRSENNGKWILLKQYGTFNPYYTPGVVYPNGSVLVLRNIIDLFFENKNIQASQFSKLPFIKEPSLNINNDNFKINYKNYKIM